MSEHHPASSQESPPRQFPPMALKGQGPFSLLSGGGKAFGQVPGLKWLVVRGFILLYGLFTLLGVGMYQLVFRYAIAPLAESVDKYQAGEGFFASIIGFLASALIFITEVLLLTASLTLALILSISMMSIWFEALAVRVAGYMRGETPPGEGFSLKGWLVSIGQALLDNLRLILVAIVAVALGFVPLVGPLLVFLVTAWLLGYEVREPYLMARQAFGENIKGLRKGLTWFTLKTGALPTLLAMIPWLGWVFLPLLMIFLVAGAAWQGEGGQPKSTVTSATSA